MSSKGGRPENGNGSIYPRDGSVFWWMRIVTERESFEENQQEPPTSKKQTAFCGTGWTPGTTEGYRPFWPARA